MYSAPFNCHIGLRLMLWFPNPQKPEFVLESTSPSLGDDEALSAKSSTIHSRDHKGASSLPPRLPQKRHEDIQSPYRAAAKDYPDDNWIENYRRALSDPSQPWQPGRYSPKYHGPSTSHASCLVSRGQSDLAHSIHRSSTSTAHDQACHAKNPCTLRPAVR
jgi:hypothetical protein